MSDIWKWAERDSEGNIILKITAEQAIILDHALPRSEAGCISSHEWEEVSAIRAQFVED